MPDNTGNFTDNQHFQETDPVVTQQFVDSQNTSVQNKYDYSVIALVLSNLTVLIGVLFWHWNLGLVIFTYFIETVFIAFWSVIKIIKKSMLGAIIFVPLFLLHFGTWILFSFFMSFTLFLVGELGTGGGSISGDDFLNSLKPVAISAIGLFLSHAVSFYRNFIKKQEYLNTNIVKLMFIPYVRTSFLFPVVFMGAVLVINKEKSVIFVSLFVIMKIIFDLILYSIEHGKLVKVVVGNSIKKSLASKIEEIDQSAVPKTPEQQKAIENAKTFLNSNLDLDSLSGRKEET